MDSYKNRLANFVYYQFIGWLPVAHFALDGLRGLNGFGWEGELRDAYRAKRNTGKRSETLHCSHADRPFLFPLLDYDAFAGGDCRADDTRLILELCELNWGAGGENTVIFLVLLEAAAA